MENYREHLKKGLQRYFDITEDYQIGHHQFDLYANFNQRNARYMLSKQIEVYAYATNEYIFHKKFDQAFCEDDFEWLKSFYNDYATTLMQSNKEHMSSTVTVIIESPLPTVDIKRKLEKFKYYKSFAFGLKGWINGKVLLIDPSMNQGISNKYGKGDMKRFLLN